MKLHEVKPLIYKLSNLDWYNRMTTDRWLDMFDFLQSNTIAMDFEQITPSMIEEFLKGNLLEHLKEKGIV